MQLSCRTLRVDHQSTAHTLASGGSFVDGQMDGMDT